MRLRTAEGVQRYEAKDQHRHRGCDSDSVGKIRPAHRGLHICDPAGRVVRRAQLDQRVSLAKLRIPAPGWVSDFLSLDPSSSTRRLSSETTRQRLLAGGLSRPAEAGPMKPGAAYSPPWDSGVPTVLTTPSRRDTPLLRQPMLPLTCLDHQTPAVQGCRWEDVFPQPAPSRRKRRSERPE